MKEQFSYVPASRPSALPKLDITTSPAFIPTKVMLYVM